MWLGVIGKITKYYLKHVQGCVFLAALESRVKYLNVTSWNVYDAGV